jgi:hypothetical protein
VEGQTPLPAATPKPQQGQKAESVAVVKGRALFVTIFASDRPYRCLVLVELPDKEPNKLGLPPGTAINSYAPSESFCTLFGLSTLSIRYRIILSRVDP